jgi:hypothetical protein
MSPEVFQIVRAMGSGMNGCLTLGSLPTKDSPDLAPFLSPFAETSSQQLGKVPNASCPVLKTKGKRGALRPVERYLGHPEMAYTPESNLAVG